MTEEGSVDVDERDDSSTEETSEEETSEETVDKNEDQETDSSEEKEEVLTDKGTKLDPDPKSAVHQELANANRRVQEMERVLGSPELLRKYAKDSGVSLAEAKAEVEESKEAIEEFDPDNLQTAGDVAKALNVIRSNSTSELKALKEENKRLREDYEGISSRQHVQSVASTMQQDITAVRGKYPELNPDSQEYDKDLEKEIGELYHELDYNQDTRSYRGSVSIGKLTDRVMKAAGKARKQGSKQAQTDVRVKKAGKVVTSSKGKVSESESDDPATAIAQRIAKTLSG